MTNMPAAWRGFLFAARFLTRWPLPDPGMPTADQLRLEMGRTALFYPLVGLLLGASLAAVSWLLAAAPTLAAAALLLILWVWSTGALHLDGLADCADAWVGGLGSRERTFDILKDPHSGAMGVVALILILIAKLACVAALLEQGTAPLVLLGLPALARAQVLALALTTPYARVDGMGAAMRTHLPRRAGWLVLLLTWVLAVTLVLYGLGAIGLVLLLPALLVFWRWRASLVQRLGGYTGDGAGALVEMTEIALLFSAALAT